MTASAGRAVPHINWRSSDDHGNRLGPDQVGEVVVGGPRVMDWLLEQAEARRRTRCATVGTIPATWDTSMSSNVCSSSTARRT